MKTPKRKKPRTHLPALSEMQRKMMQTEMDANPKIPRAVSRAVMDSLNAAANPQAETPETVIQTLEPDDRTNVQMAAQGYAQTLGAVGARGRMALMLDSELDAMIAAEGDEE